MYVDPDNKELVHHFTETHGYGTIPWLSASPESDKKDYTLGKFFDDNQQWNIISGDSMLGVNQIEFVNKVLGHDVKLTLTFKQTVMANALIVGILAGAVAFVIIAYPCLIA
jgi:hypothetical protein